MNNQYNPSITKGVEATFFGKVMFFFALAIAMSALGVYVSMEYLMEYFMVSPAIMIVLFVLELGLVFTSKMWSTKIPLNRFLFAAFAFITGVTISPLIWQVTGMVGGGVLLYKALGITGATFTSVALLGYNTSMDLTGMRGFLMTSLIGMIVVGIASIFFPWGNTFEMIFSGFGVILFAGFTAYDFQKIKKYPEDRYIDAALNLYLDIFNMFIYVLRLLLALSRD